MLLASGICKARTIAIEASTKTAVIIQKNIDLNQLQNRATVINAAAGANAGTLNFFKNEDSTNHVITSVETQNTESELVNIIKIDDLAAKNQLILIKIDVEGYETEVLKGMTETLNQTLLKAIIIELNGCGTRYGFSDEEIHQLLKSKNFEPYQYDPFTRDLTLLTTYGLHNTIYCRDISFIYNRLKLAARFNVMGEYI